MGLRIKTNVQSLVAQNQLGMTNERLARTQERLSTGSKIVRAMDDAAGLAISENLRADVRATGQNIKNANSGFFLLQTAEGALEEVSNILIRMKELAVQAASDTNGDLERGYIDNEYQALKSELDRISATTEFNGRPLLNGEGGALDIQVGRHNIDEEDRIRVSSNFEITTDSMDIADLDVLTADSARGSLDPLDDALQVIAKARGSIGAAESRLSVTMKSLGRYEENISSAFSEIRDADIAYETSELAKDSILRQAGTAVLAQANSLPQLALKLLG